MNTPLSTSSPLHELSLHEHSEKTFPIHIVNRAFLIDGKYKTEVVRIVHADKIIFIITQLDSLAGCVIRAEKDSANNLTMSKDVNYDDDLFDQVPEPTYSIKTLFGKRAPSLDNPTSETYIDIETIFARLLIEQLYKPKQNEKLQIPGMLEPIMPVQALEKPLILCLTFSKDFQSRLKQSKIGKHVMNQLIDCVVNKI